MTQPQGQKTHDCGDTAGVWELQVLGKNGVTVQGTLHTPSSPPVVLRSQDLIQIADRSFYFLLPRQQQWWVHQTQQLCMVTPQAPHYGTRGSKTSAARTVVACQPVSSRNVLELWKDAGYSDGIPLQC